MNILQNLQNFWAFASSHLLLFPRHHYIENSNLNGTRHELAKFLPNLNSRRLTPILDSSLSPPSQTWPNRNRNFMFVTKTNSTIKHASLWKTEDQVWSYLVLASMFISSSSPSSNFIFVSTSHPTSRFVFAKLSHVKTRYKKFLVKWNFFRRNEKKRRQDSHSMCWVVRWTTSQWFSPNISREDWFRCANIEFLVKVDICQVVVRFVSPYRFQFGLDTLRTIFHELTLWRY